jgi:hypothetical protein
MYPSDRRTAYIRLLAEIDQRIAECEERSQQVLTFEEHALVRAQLKMRIHAKERVERLLMVLESA